MMASLLGDPIAWWPFGLVIGALIGGFARRYDGRRARCDDPIGDAGRPDPSGPLW